MARTTRNNQIARSQTYHIINRGALRQVIFHDEDDIRYFLALLRRYQASHRFQLYHWVIMNNHYHLVLELEHPRELSKIIGAIQQLYAHYHHRRYQTAGQLFQNRFKSQAIEKGIYLLACGRYVERNPVRAGLVTLPWEWPWSSAHHYIGTQDHDITQSNPEWLAGEGTTDDYQQWLLDSSAPGDDALFRRSVTLIGTTGFSKQLVSINGRLSPRGPGRPRK